ncbi:MAG: glycosyltransferase [Treponema phagedenis]|uniref:glycosyltransferase n=1 Tax=Treponema phagedenis TaxID=162 RepID=UPI0031341F92
MINFLKVILCPYKIEARSQREVSAVKEIIRNGIAVLELGEKEANRNEDGVDIYTYTGHFTGGVFNRLSSFLKWAIYIRKFKAKCISCYDISALTIAWASTLFLSEKNKPKLVYDSHEFELGRNSNRSKFDFFCVKMMEKFLIKKSVFSIMVNDTIADEIMRIYKLKERPLVVRSVQNYVDVDESIVNKHRDFFYQKYNIKPSDFIVMYHGVIMNGRGIETIIEAVKTLDGVKVIILGFGKQDYINTLNAMIEDAQLSTKVFFHEAVDQNELWKYVGASDVGIVAINNVCLSYYYSLPNKFFQNIQAHTPIIGVSFPEIKKMIEKYDIGIICEPDSPDSLGAAIFKLKSNNHLYSLYKVNLKKAAKELCWENEKLKLIEKYKTVFEDI